VSERLDALARRAATDDFFLGAALADYARSEGLDDAALAGRLGCPAAALTGLRLCRRPRPEAPLFAADVGRISEHFGLDADVLADAVRRADALAALRAGGLGAGGVLQAARDRGADDRPAGRGPIDQDARPDR
jgi:hypothetical protein